MYCMMMTVQLAKVGKVLLAIEQGRIHELKGKSLKEIDLQIDNFTNWENIIEGDKTDEEVDLVKPESSVLETHDNNRLSSDNSCKKDGTGSKRKRRILKKTTSEESGK